MGQREQGRKGDTEEEAELAKLVLLSNEETQMADCTGDSNALGQAGLS